MVCFRGVTVVCAGGRPRGDWCASVAGRVGAPRAQMSTALQWWADGGATSSHGPGAMMSRSCEKKSCSIRKDVKI